MVFYHKQSTHATKFVVELNRNAAIHDTGGMPKEPTVRTTVLLPVELYERLKVIANKDRRSAHQEIIFAVERLVTEREAADARGDEK